MRPALIAVLFCLIFCGVSAGNVRKVSASYTYYAPKNMSVEEAERIAVDRAKIQAIADAFGTFITQSNSNIISTEDGSSDTHFFSLSGSDVKGEWIETTKVETKPSFEDRCVVIECYVEGKAKEISASRVEYEAMTLCNIPDIKFNTTNFSSGDDLFLYFKAPVAGYLNVFLLDSAENEAYCLLPYGRSQAGAYRIKADKEYYLFSEDKDETDRSVVDEYTLTSNSAKEFNELVIVFSPKEFNKAGLKSQMEATAPKVTTIAGFNEWLSKLKAKNDNITTSTITLTISGK